MITNNSMKKILEMNEIISRINNIKLEPKLASILAGGIVEIDGCYFLKELVPLEFNLEEAEKHAFDLTEIECDINHIHIGDYVSQSKDNIPKIIEQGTRYTLSLQELLPRDENFKVIQACTFEPIFDCNVRFHKQRVGEKWVMDDIEKYEEAVMVLG